MHVSLRVIITIALLPVCALSYAQRPIDSLILGSWKLPDLQMSDSCIGKNRVMTFYNNGIYVWEYEQGCNGNLTQYSHPGTYKIKKKGKIIEFTQRSLSSGKSKKAKKEIQDVLLVNDTMLVLTYESITITPKLKSTKRVRGTMLVQMRESNTLGRNIKSIPAFDEYKRTNYTIAITQTELIMHFPELGITANDRFVLVNSLDTTKRIKIPTGGDCEISYEEFISDTNESCKMVTLTGHIIDVNNGKVTIEYYGENIEETLKDGRMIYTSISKGDGSYADSITYRIIEISQLNEIDFKSRGRIASTAIAGTLLAISLEYAAIAAPLVSTNFKQETFDKDRYYDSLLVCLGGVIVSIPLFIAGRTRHFHIAPKGTELNKTSWYLEEE